MKVDKDIIDAVKQDIISLNKNPGLDIRINYDSSEMEVTFYGYLDIMATLKPEHIVNIYEKLADTEVDLFNPKHKEDWFKNFQTEITDQLSNEIWSTGEAENIENINDEETCERCNNVNEGTPIRIDYNLIADHTPQHGVELIDVSRKEEK